MTPHRFEIIFRQLHLPLCMYALRLCDDTGAADDIVQEAFLAAWQIYKDEGEPTDFKAYMYRCVRNGCITYMSKNRKFDNIDEIPDVSEPEIDTSERDAAVWRAIDRLPAKCRTIFLMSKRDGMSVHDIAEELSLSEQTVKNQISKALHALRTALDPARKPFFLPYL